MKGNHTIDPAQAASRIIEELDIRNPSEIIVELIAENRGATVVEASLCSSEGRLVRYGNRGKITVPLNERSFGRKRFSIGHELGHFELHGHLANIITCSKEDMTDWKGYKKRETEANLFCAELLMPKKFFEPIILCKKPNMMLIKNLAEEFKTSLTATACRYIQITREPCALIYCINSKVEWYLKNEFDFFIKKKGEKIDEYSLAYDSFLDGSDDLSGSLISASAWVQSNDSRYDDIELYESTIFLSSFNASISLLWQP